MTLADIKSIAAASNVSLVLDSGMIHLDGPDNAVDKLIPMVKKWKPELQKVLAGETMAGVGTCGHCNADLIGLPVALDGYINRVCGDCGRWATCLPPSWTPSDLVELCEDADREAVEAIRIQIEEQKSIF